MGNEKEHNSNGKLKPEEKLSIREYLDDIFQAKAKLYGAILAIVVTLGGISLYNSAQNSIEFFIKDSISDQISVKKKLLDKAFDDALNKIESLNEKKLSLNSALESTENQIKNVNNKITEMEENLKSSKTVLTAVNKFDTFKSEIVNQLTKDKKFINDLQKSILKVIPTWPAGAIIPYFGTKEEFDSLKQLGWVVCDGKNGTPDLSDRFICGTVEFSQRGITGGSKSHNHEGSTSRASDRTTLSGPLGTKCSMPSHTHNLNISGSEHLPPYIYLIYIMKKA